MILKDIKKLQDFQNQLDSSVGKEKKRLLKKCKKIESKYRVDKSVDTHFYSDKIGNKVAVLKSGEVIQFQESSLSVRFLSFLTAFLILLILFTLSTFIVTIWFPKYSFVLNSSALIVSFLSVSLITFTILRTWDTLKNKFWLACLMALSLLLNIVVLIDNITNWRN
jgi:hypothetical protein